MSTGERDRAASLAKENHPAALEAARRIPEAWFRSQALAWVARFAPDSLVRNLIAEAVAAARASTDAYEKVAALAWSLRALLERGHLKDVGPLFASALKDASAIDNAVRRVDALFLVAQAVWPEAAWRSEAASAVVGAARSTPSRKASVTLRDLALLVASTGGDSSTVVAAIADPKSRRQAERRIEEKVPFAARPFFW
jgi:hypothetical protein